MECHVMFQCMYVLYNVQTRINMSVSSDMYHFFMVKPLKVISSGFQKYAVCYCYLQGLRSYLCP